MLSSFCFIKSNAKRRFAFDLRNSRLSHAAHERRASFGRREASQGSI